MKSPKLAGEHDKMYKEARKKIRNSMDLLKNNRNFESLEKDFIIRTHNRLQLPSLSFTTKNS